MLMNDKIIFDRYYCINSAKAEMMMHYILQLRHIFIHVKAFILMLVLVRVQFLIISTCFAWRSVTNIYKSHVLTACAHENCYINAWISFHQYMAVDIV